MYHPLNTLELVFPAEKIPESGVVEMFSYLQSARQLTPLNSEEVKKALAEKSCDMNLIEKPAVLDSPPKSTLNSVVLQSPLDPSESKILLPEATSQRALELHFRTRGPCFEEKLMAYLTETLNQVLY